MNRTQLEHIIRAASQIWGDAEIVVVGSQAISWREFLERMTGIDAASSAGRSGR